MQIARERTISQKVHPAKNFANGFQEVMQVSKLGAEKNPMGLSVDALSIKRVTRLERGGKKAIKAYLVR
jgi:hypothetical protein